MKRYNAYLVKYISMVRTKKIDVIKKLNKKYAMHYVLPAYVMNRDNYDLEELLNAFQKYKDIIDEEINIIMYMYTMESILTEGAIELDKTKFIKLLHTLHVYSQYIEIITS
jgi:hypothetical protein